MAVLPIQISLIFPGLKKFCSFSAFPLLNLLCYLKQLWNHDFISRVLALQSQTSNLLWQKTQQLWSVVNVRENKDLAYQVWFCSLSNASFPTEHSNGQGSGSQTCLTCRNKTESIILIMDSIWATVLWAQSCFFNMNKVHSSLNGAAH